MQHTFSRADRVAEQLHREISSIMQRQVSDPRLQSLTITRVKLSPDLKNAKVFVMPLGGKKKDDVLDSLNKVSGRIKKIISNNLSLRQTPKLIFKIDETFEYANKIHHILEKIKK